MFLLLIYGNTFFSWYLVNIRLKPDFINNLYTTPQNYGEGGWNTSVLYYDKAYVSNYAVVSMLWNANICECKSPEKSVRPGRKLSSVRMYTIERESLNCKTSMVPNFLKAERPDGKASRTNRPAWCQNNKVAKCEHVETFRHLTCLSPLVWKIVSTSVKQGFVCELEDYIKLTSYVYAASGVRLTS